MVITMACCRECGRASIAGSMYRDLDGDPILDYYCDDCAGGISAGGDDDNPGAQAPIIILRRQET